MPWKNNTWVDDDGSLTVGTPFDAEHMNNIELGIAEDAAGVAAASGMAGSALVQAASGVTAAGSALVTAQQANVRAASGVTAAGSALVTGQFAGALAASGVTAAGSALVTGQKAGALAASGVAAAGSGVTGVTNLLNKLAASGEGVVLHGSNANVQRPFGFDSVLWIGTVEPLNAAETDPWINPEDFGIYNAPFVPAARVFKAAGQSLPVNTATPLVFDSESYDNAGIHSTVTNTSRMVAPKAGVYLIAGYWSISTGGTAATAYGYCDLLKNGGVAGLLGLVTERCPAEAFGIVAMSINTVVFLEAGEYVEFRGFQANPEGVAKTTAEQTLSMTWLGTGTSSSQPIDWGIVTELPSAAGVGDYCSLKVREDETRPWKLWRCQKLEPSGERPWVKIGGPPLSVDYTGAEFLQNTTETPSTTNAPSITIPAVKMEAEVEWGANASFAEAASTQPRMALFVAGTAITPNANDFAAGSSAPSANVVGAIKGQRNNLVLASGVAVVARYYRSGGSGPVNFYTPYLKIDPVRLG